jgi:hypothetical protein
MRLKTEIESLRHENGTLREEPAQHLMRKEAAIAVSSEMISDHVSRKRTHTDRVAAEGSENENENENTRIRRRASGAQYRNIDASANND